MNRLRLVTIEQSLFGDEPEAVRAVDPSPAMIKDSKVDLIRKALDARGLTSMIARQSLIEQLAGRPIDSLRALNQPEALSLLSKLGSRGPSAGRPTWDDRDEGTWIDSKKFANGALLPG